MIYISYYRYENETDEELIYRITGCKDEIGSWKDVADILNELLNTEYSESKFRKQRQAFDKMLKTYQQQNNSMAEMDNNLTEKLQEIKKEKQKLSDERAALNRKLRNESRLEENLSILENLIAQNGQTTLPSRPVNFIKNENDMVICLSDFHLGQTVDNFNGKYNSQIAKERLTNYLLEIKRINDTHKCENAYVILLGDLVSGEIHITTQLENRENLTEQVQKAGELISAFIYGLSGLFNNVYVNNVAGNHSRTNAKDLVLRNNRLDDLIPWYIKAKLSHLDNIIFIDNENIDNTIAAFEVRGNKCIAVHGDFDSFSQSGLSNLVMMIGYKPNFVFSGHMHHNTFESLSDVNMIQSGSFCGTGDDYCISKRITGKPSQTVCILNNQGLKCLYPIIFE